MKSTEKRCKIIDIKSQIGNYTLEKLEDCVRLVIMLPAGSVNNVNPSLLVTALETINNISVYSDITRLDVLMGRVTPLNSKFTTVLLDADETVLDFHTDERNALKILLMNLIYNGQKS